MANRTPAFPSSYQARSTRSHVTPSPAPRLLLLSLPCLGPHDAFDLNSVPAFSQLGAAIPPPLATFGSRVSGSRLGSQPCFMALIPSPRHCNYRSLSVLPALPVHPLPAGSPHTPRPRFFLGPLRSWSLACQEIMLPVWPLAPSSPHKASLSRSTYNGPLSSSCFHFTIYNPPRFSYSSCTMAAQIYNPDHTMSAAEEEALGASGDDLAVDNLPEGMFHHLADPADLLAAKKPCMVPDASPPPILTPPPPPVRSRRSLHTLPCPSLSPLSLRPCLAWHRRWLQLQHLPIARQPAQPHTRMSPQAPTRLPRCPPRSSPRPPQAAPPVVYDARARMLLPRCLPPCAAAW
ncbi:unnamed protein product [Closterium sp. NIES-53]